MIKKNIKIVILIVVVIGLLYGYNTQANNFISQEDKIVTLNEELTWNKIQNLSDRELLSLNKDIQFLRNVGYQVIEKRPDIHYEPNRSYVTTTLKTLSAIRKVRQYGFYVVDNGSFRRDNQIKNVESYFCRNQ